MESEHAPERSAEPLPRSTDKIAIAYGVGAFTLVLLCAYALWLVKFQVSLAVQQTGAIAAIVAFVLWTVRGTPSSRLRPDRRAIRDHRRMAGLVGASSALLGLGVFVAIFQLRDWSEWVVLANLLLATVGLGFALHTHLLFRKR